jgi:hypothetical protein
MKNINLLLTLLVFLTFSIIGFAGNPDRQGEAGASELLFNPWPSSSALHSMNTSSVSGIAALRLNPAGIGRGIGRAEIGLSNSRLYEGSELQFNALGIALRMGSSHAMGVSLAAVDFGDIPITWEDLPEGTGATFSPSFYHIGVGYAFTYENKISVGALLRLIGESTANVSAFGAAIDAGVQYISGPQENFRLGISLRNIGTPMSFDGSGLDFRGPNPGGTSSYQMTFRHRTKSFELPSVLNIGFSYDYYVAPKTFVRGIGNFTSNAFSLDQVGAGVEFSWRDLIVLRGSYMLEIGEANVDDRNIYSGPGAGFTVNVPLSKNKQDKIAIDYSYRTTHRFRGSHNFCVRIDI